MKNHHAINGKSHYKSPFSIAILNYRRVDFGRKRSVSRLNGARMVTAEKSQCALQVFRDATWSGSRTRRDYHGVYFWIAKSICVHSLRGVRKGSVYIIYIYTYTCPCMHACMQTNKRTNKQANIQTYKHTHTHTHAHTHTLLYIRWVEAGQPCQSRRLLFLSKPY